MAVSTSQQTGFNRLSGVEASKVATRSASGGVSLFEKLYGDGSVMMVGGGGYDCSLADHGIGITEAHAASFVEHGDSQTEYDFGYDALGISSSSPSYSLNLWIR